MAIESTNIKIVVMHGDITMVKADALITAINSSRRWLGGIDGAIQGVAGNYYHAQASAKRALYNLQTIVARGHRNHHNGGFDNVVFVVDDLQSPLRNVISEGLEAADADGMETVLIPAIRTGVMLGVREGCLEQVVFEYIHGIEQYIIRTASIGDKPNIKAIAFVIYKNQQLEDILNKALKNKGWL